MSPSTEFAAQAAKCRELAEKAKTEQDRKRWLDMEQYWLRRARGGGDPAENVVKI